MLALSHNREVAHFHLEEAISRAEFGFVVGEITKLVVAEAAVEQAAAHARFFKVRLRAQLGRIVCV